MFSMSARSVGPGGQPAADVAAAGNGGEIVEPRQQPAVGQPLDHAEGEGGAPDAAAGDAQRTERLLLAVDGGDELGLATVERRLRAERPVLAGQDFVEKERRRLVLHGAV